MRTARTRRFDLTRYARQAAERIRRRHPARRDRRAVVEPVEGRQLMTVSFADPALHDLPILVDPVAVATADFNNDGKLDAAAIENTSNSLFILLGNGDGTLAAPATLTIGDNARDLVAADFNGDGKADLAISIQNSTGNGSDDEVHVLLGNGDGTFASPIEVNASGIRAGELAAADLNGDGRADLVVGNQSLSNSKIGILLNNGNGTFGQMATHSLSAGVRGIAIGDINNDGHNDIVAVMQQTMAASLLNNGNGTFSQPMEFQALNSGRGEGIVLGNFVGDANLDLAVVSEDGDDFGLLMGNGDGTFGAPTVVDDGARNAIVAHDFDGDGDVDFVTSAGLGNQVEWYTNAGNGTVARSGFDFPGWNSYHLATGDFNGDGKMDVIATGEHPTRAGQNGAGYLAVYLNRSNGNGGGSNTGGGNSGGQNPGTPAPPAIGVDLAASSVNVLGKKTSFIGGVGKAGTVAKIKNVGDTAYKGQATVNWYVSADGVIDASDTLITSRSKFVNLKAGKQAVFKTKLLMPNVPDGQYQILAEVVQGSGTDADAGNNTAAAAGAYTIAAPFVDLTGWFKTAPLSIGPKGAFSTLQIRNDGNVKASGPLNIKYYLSTDTTLDAGDTEVASFTKQTTIQPGKTINRRQKLTAPEGLSGYHYLIASINGDNTIVESLLSNNQAFSDLPILV